MTVGDRLRGRGFWILGPVEVRNEDGPIAFGGSRSRCLLGCLLLDAGRVVSIDRLIDAVWDERPPSAARVQVQNRVSTLRTRLRDGGFGDSVIVRQPPGYLLQVDGIPFDLGQFDRDIARAEALGSAGRLAEATDAYRAALSLWHGPALSGLETSFLRTAAQRLDERRLHALETCLGLDLELGRYAQVADESAVLADQHPYRERTAELLIRALSRSGRRLAAIEAYHRIRERLGTDLGLDPGARLEAAFQAVLHGTEPAAPKRPGERIVPAQLPADVPFAGREEELRTLDAVLSSTPRRRSCVVVAGTPGVGKSTLAAHWAHRVLPRFPDGQLYVNLRGFSPHGPPMTTDEALRGFLDALQVPAEDIPTGLQARVGLYRSLLAGRRMLVVLDDARDADQVRHLLPGADGCLAVVTSRDPLAGLAVTEGAQIIHLGLLDVGEARLLLAQRIGAHRVAAEPGPVARIVELCSGLPLALAVAAARADTDARMPLATLAEQLHLANGTLDVFSGTDRASDLRAVLSLSYRALSPDAARVFRHLHLRIGARISSNAAASLTGLAVHRVRPLLAELATASLLVRQPPDHHTGHDLLQSYAAEVARDVDQVDARRAGGVRLLDYYLHSAYAADHSIYPHREAIELVPAASGVVPERFDDACAATAWFATEMSVLLDAIERAAADGHHTHAWQLAWSLTTYLNRSGHWHEWARAQRTGLTAAARLGDPVAQAHCHRNLANAATRLRQYDTARTHLNHALTHFREQGDLDAQVRCYNNLAWAEERAGRITESLSHARTALALVRQSSTGYYLSNVLNAVGWYHALLGDFDLADTYCRQGLKQFIADGDRHGQAYALDSLGYAAQHRGNHGAAVRHYHRAIALCDEIGERFLKAQLLLRLGDTHQAARRASAARNAWYGALEIFEALDRQSASAVRRKLN